MLHIVIEDAKDRCGWKLWEGLLAGLGLTSINLDTSEGKDNLENKLSNMLEDNTISPGDTVIVSLDNFATNAYEIKYSIFNTLGIDFITTYISRYGSIEAVLLSFKRFFSWVHFRNGDYPVDVSVYLNALKLFWIRCRNERLFPRDDERIEDFQESSYFQELDRNVGLYYPIEPGNSYDPFHECDWLIKPYYDAIQGPDRKNQIRNPPTTAEQATSRLLESLTFNSGFKSKKGDLGKCWNNDCCHDANRNSEGKIFPGSSLKACNSSWISDDELMTAISDITVIPGKTPFEKLQWVHTRDMELRAGLCPEDWTSRDKALMLLFESDFKRGFSDEYDNVYSLAEILGINSPDDNPLPPPEPLPETEPQWNQQQATSPAWNAYQQPTPPQEPQPPQSSTRGGMRSQVRMQQYYTDVGNPYQQPAEAREQAPQSHNQLPAPAGNPDNIECTATSAFGAIEGYLFCTPRGTYGIWKESKNKKVISIVGLTDEQLITIGPAEKKSIKELRAEFNSWKQKQIGSYGNGWELNDSVSIAFGDKPRQNPPNQ